MKLSNIAWWSLNNTGKGLNLNAFTASVSVVTVRDVEEINPSRHNQNFFEFSINRFIFYLQVLS